MKRRALQRGRQKRRPRGLTRGNLRLIIMIVALALVVSAYALANYILPAPNPGNGSGCRGSAKCLEGEVTEVVDGDTLRIGNVKIRLALVDTPEVGEAGYDEATNFTAALCPVGSQALVDQDDLQLEDVYGRMLAVVHCGGKNLNEELLENGHASLMTGYCAESEFGTDAWARAYGC